MATGASNEGQPTPPAPDAAGALQSQLELHQVMLQKILQNVEDVSQKLNSLQLEKLSDIGAGSDALPVPRTIPSTATLNRSDRSTLVQEGAATIWSEQSGYIPMDDQPMVSPLATTTSQTNVLSVPASPIPNKATVTKTWVQFVDGLKTDDPVTEDWSAFTSSKTVAKSMRLALPVPLTGFRMWPIAAPHHSSKSNTANAPSSPAYSPAHSHHVSGLAAPVPMSSPRSHAISGAEAIPEAEVSSDQLGNEQDTFEHFADLTKSLGGVKHSGASGWLNHSNQSMTHSMRAQSDFARVRKRDIVFSRNTFDTFSCALIFGHILYIGVEVELGIASAKSGRDEPEWLFLGDMAFALLFAIELFIRIAVDGRRFLKGKDRYWNAFDTFVFVLQAIDAVFHFYRLGALRVLRVVRILRAARVMRTVKYVTELRLMVMSIISTLSSLFWAFLLLLLVLYLVGIGIMQLVEHHIRNDSGIMDDQVKYAALLDYYGSLADCLLTLFMSISGGADWNDLLQPLKDFSKAYVLIYVFYIAFMVFGVTNVLTAIFVESASQIAAIDQDLAIQDQLRRDKSTINMIRAMFHEADEDRSGSLTLVELENLLVNPKYIWAMRLIGVDVSEARRLFQLLDTNESDAVCIEEFITGMMRLKGSAKGVDLASHIYETKRTHCQLQEALGKISCHLSEVEQLLLSKASLRSPPSLGSQNLVARRPQVEAIRPLAKAKPEPHVHFQEEEVRTLAL
mmetsp:Transcript_55318/g.131989  ORF Transcript_55318/g.131989 Transcript_55318/m.131989 type:complete len:736 (+) Transcript_55318:108-2315(+)